MTEPHDIDRYLSGRDDDLVPSAGFAEGVMAAIAREASVPPPIGFPWTRALPGLLGAAVSGVTLVLAAFQDPGGNAAPFGEAWTRTTLEVLVGLGSAATAGLVLTLLLTLRLALLAVRLVRTAS